MPNSSTSYVDAAGATKALAANLGADAKLRPVHHSEVVVIQVAKTRPADTTAYAAGDAQGAAADVVFAFDIGALAMVGALLVGARLIRKDVTNVGQRHRLFIHDAVPPTLTNADNAAFPLLWANRASRRGWVDFVSPIVSDAAGGDVAEFAGAMSNAQGIALAPTDGIVRGILTTRDAFTPASATDLLIELDFIA